MVRPVPWDDLPGSWVKEKAEEKRKSVVMPSSPMDSLEEKKEVDMGRAVLDIGRRIAFGVICGSLTGAAFGFVDVLRDSKAMLAKKSVATQKVLRTTGVFAGFFGTYHGTRKALHIFNPMPPENNVFFSAVISMTPLVVVRGFRPMLPYAVMLVALDAFTGMDDI